MRSPSAPSPIAEVDCVVGVGQMTVSTARQGQLITYALGSCLGITVFDPVAHVGGLIHVMLPQASSDTDRSPERVAMFVDSGLPKLFRDCYALGAEKSRMKLAIAGGASLRRSEADDDFFQIGRRNIAMARKLLWKNGVTISASDLGGHGSRTMTLRLSDGSVMVRSNGQDRALLRLEDSK